MLIVQPLILKSAMLGIKFTLIKVYVLAVLFLKFRRASVLLDF